MSNLSLRTMLVSDIDFALRQTSREGWGVPREAFELCLAHDPDGAFIAQQGSEPIGLVTTTCYAATAWIGHLIVSPDYRYRGLGESLMNRAIQHIRNKGIECIWLDADPPGIKLYQRLGFTAVNDSLRYAGRLRSIVGDQRPRPVEPSDLADLADFDRQHVGDDRKAMLTLMLQYANKSCLIREAGNILGYGMTWLYDGGVRLGPIVATDAAIAKSIIASLAQYYDDTTAFTVGVLASNALAIALYETLEMQRTPASFRMILSANVRQPSGQIFAMANGAIG